MNSRSTSKLTLTLKRESVTSWTYEVIITDRDGRHILSVELDKSYHQALTSGTILPLVLVQESVFYLLEREPARSILGTFNIKEIVNYFPSYESDIKRDLGL